MSVSPPKNRKRWVTLLSLKNHQKIRHRRDWSPEKVIPLITVVVLNLKSARAEVSRKNFFLFGRKYGVSWRERSSDFSFFFDLKNIALRKKRGVEKRFFLFFFARFPKKERRGKQHGRKTLCSGMWMCVGKRFLSRPPLKREGEEGKTLPLSSPVSPPLLPFPNGAGGKGERFLSCLFFWGGGELCVSCGYFPKIRSCGDDVVEKRNDLVCLHTAAILRSLY